MNRIIYTLIFSLLLISCGERKQEKQLSDLEIKMNNIAEGYVKLVLNIGQYDPVYVDAYYGPKEWKSSTDNLQFDSTAYNELSSIADSLLNELELLSEYKATELETLRYNYLYKQLLAVKTKIVILNGTALPFDLESKAFYDVSVPLQSEVDFHKTIDEIDKILPGSGNIEERMVNFKKQFQIPKEKLTEVFDAAIKECRERTRKYIQLPPGENFKVEYVENKPWGAYNWYKGDLHSVIQIATDFPIYINSPVGLAAHEGYPGHHVYNVLLEKNLVKNRGWIEYTVYPLYSPQSFIAEGTANYGEEILFPGDERIKFEKEVLFPLAGLDTKEADLYYKITNLQKELEGAGVIAARNYLNDEWAKEKTVAWLQKFQLRTKERAEKYLSFIEAYRSYVINYDLGKKIIRDYVERNGGTDDNLARRWETFTKLISTPQTPSGLLD
ncbi:MAG: hypothetical protein WBN42_11510 [Ignavibacteriaceae bacterium]